MSDRTLFALSETAERTHPCMSVCSCRRCLGASRANSAFSNLTASVPASDASALAALGPSLRLVSQMVASIGSQVCCMKCCCHIGFDIHGLGSKLVVADTNHQWRFCLVVASQNLFRICHVGSRGNGLTWALAAASSAAIWFFAVFVHGSKLLSWRRLRHQQLITSTVLVYAAAAGSAATFFFLCGLGRLSFPP